MGRFGSQLGGQTQQIGFLTIMRLLLLSYGDEHAALLHGVLHGLVLGLSWW